MERAATAFKLYPTTYPEFRPAPSRASIQVCGFFDARNPDMKTPNNVLV